MIGNLRPMAFLDGRELRYRDLERLLANEKSVVKRRALYATAVPTIERLSRSLHRREQRTEVLLLRLGTTLQVPTPWTRSQPKRLRSPLLHQSLQPRLLHLRLFPRSEPGVASATARNRPTCANTYGDVDLALPE